MTPDPKPELTCGKCGNHNGFWYRQRRNLNPDEPPNSAIRLEIECSLCRRLRAQIFTPTHWTKWEDRLSYKDKGDEWITRRVPVSNDIRRAWNQLKQNFEGKDDES